MDSCDFASTVELQRFSRAQARYGQAQKRTVKVAYPAQPWGTAAWLSVGGLHQRMAGLLDTRSNPYLVSTFFASACTRTMPWQVQCCSDRL